jgi:hypothetical protein
MMADRELCDEQHDEAMAEHHRHPHPPGTAGFVDQAKKMPWHDREQSHLKEEQRNA